jgi:raffinose/stachyose/melibiose transport system permease protein
MIKPGRLWIVLFLLPALVLFLLVYLGPLVTAAVTSFTKWNGVQAPRFIGLANYLRLAGNAQFQAAFGNTIKWVLAAAFIHVPFGVLVALVLFKRPRGWRFTRAVFMIPNVLGWTALSILFMFIYLPDAGILNGLIQLLGFRDFNRNWLYDPGSAFTAVTLIWLFFAAVITLITMSELMAIPESLADSARIDGASPLQIDLYINLPIIWPIVGTGVVIAVTSVLKAFEIIFLTTGGGPGNRTINISVIMVNRLLNSQEYGYANALAVVLLIMGMVAILLVQWLFRLGRSYRD